MLIRTVFDYDPTPAEIEDCGFNKDISLSIRHGLHFPYPLTPDGYRNSITAEAAAFDLHLLFDGRGDKARADTYAALVPEKVAEYRRGFDYQLVEVRD